MRYFLELAYSGTAYNGWQIQPNAPSVQSALQQGLSTIMRTQIEVVGAGRTDTGVHSSFYIAHFDIDAQVEDVQKFCYHLNSILPRDIAVHSLRRVRDDAHARFDAQRREYKYFITPRKDPFNRETSFQMTLPLDIEIMNEASAKLLDYSDFTSFSKLHSDNKTNLCKITRADWQEIDGQFVFTITADRFLRNMVRAIVGTLIEVGRGKLSVADFCKVIEGQNRSLAGSSAPPQGLFLTAVDYPEDIYL